MDKGKDSSGLLRALAGPAVFVLLYSATFVPAAIAGISITEWVSILGSRNAFLFEAYYGTLAERGTAGAFGWVLALEIASSLAFGAGFSALLLHLARRAGENRMLALGHRLVAGFAVLAAAIDVAGTSFLIAALAMGGPFPAWIALWAGIAYLARLPLAYITILWVIGIAMVALMGKLLRRRQGSMPAEPKAP